MPTGGYGRKQFEIYYNRLDTPPREINIDGHTVRLTPGGSALITDEGLGREIEARHGRRGDRQFVTIEVADSNPAYGGGYPKFHCFPRAMRFRTRAERDAAMSQEGEHDDGAGHP